MGVERVERWAQHTSLWRAWAECTGGGEVEAEFHLLGPISEKVTDPGAGRRWSPRDDRVEG